MHRERLLHLRQILTAPLPAEVSEFDMYTFLTKRPEHEGCGFAACAFGCAALDPEFKAQGLEITNARDGLGQIGICYRDPDAPLERFVTNGALRRQVLHGYNAAAAFFGLTMEQTFYLFDPEAYIEHDENADSGPPIHREAVVDHIDSILNYRPMEVGGMEMVSELPE